MDPFIPLQLMLHNLCAQAQELCYQSPAVFRRELLWLAGKRQRQACRYRHCTARREGHAHHWDNHRAAGCRHRDGPEHKKMPFWGQKQMDSAKGVHHLHCIAMFVYIPHNEKKPSIFFWLPKLVFILSQKALGNRYPVYSGISTLKTAAISKTKLTVSEEVFSVFHFTYVLCKYAAQTLQSPLSW